MTLSHSQKKYLRELGHKLKPVMQIGNAGLSEAVFAEYDAALGHHELVKVRVRAGTRDERNRIIEQLCRRSAAELVSRIGNIALLYRPHAETPRIALPEPRPGREDSTRTEP